ncbi:hypothetical protein R6Q57_008948 [Mikania cordata]
MDFCMLALLITNIVSLWEGGKLGINAECARSYKDRKQKEKKHFLANGGYENIEKEKNSPPEYMNQSEWVQLIDKLFKYDAYMKRYEKNNANKAKQRYPSYHGSESYSQKQWTEMAEHGTTSIVEGWKKTHYKPGLGWANDLAEQDWEGTFMASVKLSTDRQAGPLDIPTYGLQTDRYEFYPPAITHDQRKERLTYTYMTPTLIDECGC